MRSGRDTAHGLFPAREGHFLDMAERNWPDEVKPGAMRRPEPEEAVPPLLQGQHALRVVRQLADD